MVPGLGARGIAHLIRHFGSATAVVDADARELVAVARVSRKALRSMHRSSSDRAAELLERAQRVGQVVLVPSDRDFPARLRAIPDPPPVLFAAGDLNLGQRRCVAIIGSRSHTRYGADVAGQLGEVAAVAGLVVASGMARGLDAIAQAAALRAGGASIGVLGTGADVVYPTSNRRLYDDLLRGGLVLSEQPPGDRGHAGAFPRRNRLISGLAEALVVVEAAEGSGTLITVTCALEQGRDVLAVPGPISSPTSRGTNRLLRDGAIPILEPADLLAALGMIADPSPTTSDPPPCTLSAEEARVLGALGHDPIQLDDLALRIGMPIGTMLGTLLGLEIGGLVEQLPGSMFRVRAKPRR
jgi:DNA processing protein